GRDGWPAWPSGDGSREFACFPPWTPGSGPRGQAVRPAGLSGRGPRASATMSLAGRLSTRQSTLGRSAPAVDAAADDDAEGGEGEDGDGELHGAVGDGETDPQG